MAQKFRNDKRYIAWLMQQKRKERQAESTGPITPPPPSNPV